MVIRVDALSSLNYHIRSCPVKFGVCYKRYMTLKRSDFNRCCALAFELEFIVFMYLGVFICLGVFMLLGVAMPSSADE